MNVFSIQQQLIATLGDAHRYPHEVDTVRMIETHISWVLLAGPYAYKIKKALALGFLDYSALATRRFCCEEEIRLNRRTAPDLYLDVVAIGGTPARPEFGAQHAFEYAVRMRRFAIADQMDRMLQRGALLPQHIDSLAGVVHRFHTSLPRVDAASRFGTIASIHAAARQNFEQLDELLTDVADLEDVAALGRVAEAEFAACRDIFAARREQGFVRECHGDLHLGNIVLINGEPVAFDCVEFNPALRWIDTMDEIAFTTMDLLRRGRHDLAWRFLNAMLEASGDYGGVAVLRFYLAYRAAVRAKVCAIRATQDDIPQLIRARELDICRCYLELARECLARRRPALIITCGLPGSGKTTFAQFALERLGAIRIRSDVERKRLHGLGTLESSREYGDIYSPEATARTYARLRELAQGLLKAGHTVIVDAAFLRLDEREQFRELAQSMSLPFAIAALHADEPVLHERLIQRSSDASEADTAVLKKLQKLQQPLSAQESAWTVEFTTEEASDSESNAHNWSRLETLLATRKTRRA